ncbi:MAG: YgjV family protein [Clostridiales bacterium]|nr:YgjV family protein [Clostridiales bacterium]
MLETFKINMLSTLTSMGIWYDILYNAFGVIAITLMVITYQFKKRSNIIKTYIFATVGWTIYFFLRGEFTSCILNLIGVIRSIIFLQREKHEWANSKFWLYFFLVIMVGGTGLTVEKWTDIFPLIASTLSTIAYFVLNVKLLKLLNMGNSSFWLTNNLINGTYVAAVSDSLSIISIIISFIRYKIEEKKNQDIAT